MHWNRTFVRIAIARACSHSKIECVGFANFRVSLAMSKRKQIRRVVVRSVVLFAALATTFAQLPVCACNVVDRPGLASDESCRCSSPVGNLPTHADFCCETQPTTIGCCENSDGVCSCDACCCTVDEQPTNLAVVNPIASPDDLLLDVSVASLVSVASIQPQRESRAAWQLARGSPLSAEPQPLFCVWIN